MGCYRQYPLITAQQIFNGAAQKGLDAELFWAIPCSKAQPEHFSVPQILEKLLPLASSEHLAAMGFVEQDLMPLLKVIEERLAQRQTGAQWQFRTKCRTLRKDMHKR